MRIEEHYMNGHPGKERSYFGAKIAKIDEPNSYIMLYTTGSLTASDAFLDTFISKSTDNGITWSEPVLQKCYDLGESEHGHTVGADSTLFYHNKTKKTFGFSSLAHYSTLGKSQVQEDSTAVYNIYNPETITMGELKSLPCDMKPDHSIFRAAPAQIHEFPNGDLLVPCYVADLSDNGHFHVEVLHLAFDGENMTLIEKSKPITVGNEYGDRGIYEPSIIKFNEKFYLTLRSDLQGLYAVSDDGLNFSEPKPWCWDTGKVLPNANTQQRWVHLGNKLYLCYTRVNGMNEHIFRNRAPIYICEVDTETMTLLHDTEKVAIRERKAQLGNFGVTRLSDCESVITDCEDRPNIEYFPYDYSIDPVNADGDENRIYFNHLFAE